MTKSIKSITRLLATLTAVLCSATAYADSRIVFGLHFGVPLYWPAPQYYSPPYYYPGPFYHSPPAVQVLPPFPADIPPPVAQQFHSYYYCADSRGYYPYVRECRGEWERLPAVPPSR